MSSIQTDNFLIAAFIPEFMKEPASWFEDNISRIKKLAGESSWWRNFAFFISQNETMPLSGFVRKLSEINYERVRTVALPGEFAVFGGVVDVFPVNSLSTFRLEFFGNRIELIEKIGVLITEDFRQNLLKKRKYGEEKDLNLKEGDYIVHLDHGIGIYRGTTDNKYFTIEYAAAKTGGSPDTLYVPFFQQRKISRYVGFKDPRIHRLGGESWLRTKSKAKEDVLKTAEELLQIYAKRETAERTPYPIGSEILNQLELTFEHIETDDQKRAISDVKNDMKQSKPMDRLICGDVGFGKTEIALRAAVIAAASGRQVALLCPTTILADQHFKVFSERLKKLPFNMGILSRFETKKDQQKTLESIKNGSIDIVIGTHRLLSKDIHFKNLGLLIIDEEQRFGVKQKEKFKSLRENVDVLSLSATPIPRTLYLSLSGLRSLSLIKTPPLGRRPVKLEIMKRSKEVIKETIAREIEREGQIYYLRNKITSAHLFAEQLRKLCPKARIAVAHGRMPEQGLRKIMNDFREGKIDVLLATTIIENGLDLKNVNTLIVEDCTKLGLAQSYQLKGRIGRSERQAFAYFFYNEKQLEGDAKKRIEALKKAEELGSGYRIAEADLEIRGAGNILGTKQSGTLNRVGLNLYCQMLSDTIENLKEQERNPPLEG